MISFIFDQENMFFTIVKNQQLSMEDYSWVIKISPHYQTYQQQIIINMQTKFHHQNIFNQLTKSNNKTKERYEMIQINYQYQYKKNVYIQYYSFLQISRFEMNLTSSSLSNRSRMRKSAPKIMSGIRELHLNSAQRNKIIVVRKIIMISSMKKQVKKIMQKIIQNGIQTFEESHHQILMDEAKKILDADRQKQLSKQLNYLLEMKQNSQNDSNLPQFLLKVIKYLVISPIQKSYITKIEKELKEDEILDNEIRSIQNQIKEQKNNKLVLYDLQKNGKILGMSTKVINRKKQIQNYQNKLMRSNQKLNQLSTSNNKLREKISQLRKQKNVMQNIYNKLKNELELKNQNVENTIKFANEANNARCYAQKQLKNLKQQSEVKKDQFKKQCQKLNHEIQHDIRFKQFIKSKHIEKDELDNLEEQIRLNEKNVQDKKLSNEQIEKQYQKSLAKEQQIKHAFDIIKKEMGIGDVGVQNQGKQLLNIFCSLYEKNAIMSNFVQQLGNEVLELQNKISIKKKQIQSMYLRGSAQQFSNQEYNQQLKTRIEYQKRKKQILDDQYQKSIQTMQMIKYHLIQIFTEVNMQPQLIDNLRNCNINEDNLTEFLGELQKKGLEAVQHYGQLLGQQLKIQKGNSCQVQKQIDKLNNVLTIQNVNTMNSGVFKINEFPIELLTRLREQKIKQEDFEKPLNIQQLKKFAMDSLEKLQKKQGIKERPTKSRFTVSHQNIYRNKKKYQNQ